MTPEQLEQTLARFPESSRERVRAKLSPFVTASPESAAAAVPAAPPTPPAPKPAAAPKPVAAKPPPKPSITAAMHPLLARPATSPLSSEALRDAEENFAANSEKTSDPRLRDGATEVRNIATTNIPKLASGAIGKLTSENVGAGMSPAEAEQAARGEVFAATAPDNDRDIIIPTDLPAESRAKVLKGEGLAGASLPFAAPGAYALSRAYDALTGGRNLGEDAGLTKALAPLAITLEPGWSASEDVDPSGQPVGLPSQESPVWGFLRQLKSPPERLVDAVTSYAFGPEGMEWGSDEHLKRLQFGQDTLTHAGDIGNVITSPYEMLGLDLPPMAKRASGAALVAPLLILDPSDPLSVMVGAVGEVAKGVRSALNFERRTSDIGAAAAEALAKQVDDGAALADIERAARQAGSLDERIFNVAREAARADLANRGAVEAADQLGALNRYGRVVATAQEAAAKAVDEAKAAEAAYAAAQASAAGKKATTAAAGDALKAAQDLRVKAFDLAEKAEVLKVAAENASRDSRRALNNLRGLAKVTRITEAGAKSVRFTGSLEELARMVRDAAANKQRLHALGNEYKGLQAKGAAATAADAERMLNIRDQMADIAARTITNAGDVNVAKAMAAFQSAAKGAAQASIDATNARSAARQAFLGSRSSVKQSRAAFQAAAKEYGNAVKAARSSAIEAFAKRGAAQASVGTARSVEAFRAAVKRELLDTAASLKAISEGAASAPRGRHVLNAVQSVPLGVSGPFKYGGASTVESFVRMVGIGGYRASRMLVKFDPVTARGFGATTPVIKQIARWGMERAPAIEQELDEVLRVDPGVDAIIDYLRGTQMPIEGGRRTALNLQVGGPLNEALQHLKYVAGDDEAWAASVVQQGISRAWNPGGLPGTNASRDASTLLRRAVEQATSGEDLLEAFYQLKKPVLVQLKRADSDDKAMRFFARAVVAGSNLNEMVRQVVRGSGPLLSDEVRRALDFIHETDATSIRALKGASYNVAEQAMETYGIGALKNDFDRFQVGPLSNATAVKNQLLRLGDGNFLPYYVWEAMQRIPVNLSKQLEEYNQAANRGVAGTAWDMVRTYMSTWRLSTTIGLWIPKFHQAAFTPFGDWNQMSRTLGFTQAARLTAGNLVAAVPFVGRGWYARLSRSSIVPSLIDPMMDPVLRADPNVTVDLFGGGLKADAAFREAVEEGAWQSFGGEMLHEVTTGARKTFFGPSRAVKDFASYLGAVQLRQRLALYLDLRRSMPRAEAGAKMREALFDWRLNSTPLEKEYLGNIVKFWNYRKNAFSQLGSVLAEGYTAPDYWAKSARGDTKIRRMMLMNKAQETVRDVTAPYQDPEEILTDDEQAAYAGTRELPWYNQGMSAVTTWVMDPRRKQWEAERALRSATHEVLYLPAAQTLDDTRLMADTLNLFAATFVSAAHSAGYYPNFTAEQVDDAWKRAANGIVDELLPPWRQAVDIATASLSTGDAIRPAGVSRDESIFYTRFVPRGMEAFAEQTQYGTWRYKNTGAAQIVRALVENPIGHNLIQTWSVFDNPSAGLNLTAWLTECLSRWTGAIRVEPFDPGRTEEIDRRTVDRNVRQVAP